MGARPHHPTRPASRSTLPIQGREGRWIGAQRRDGRGEAITPPVPLRGPPSPFRGGRGGGSARSAETVGPVTPPVPLRGPPSPFRGGRELIPTPPPGTRGRA